MLPFSVLAFLVYSPVIIVHAAQAFGVVAIPETLLYSVINFLGPQVLQQLLSAALIFGVFQRLRQQKATFGDSLSRGAACLLPETARVSRRTS